ncbi:O-antigen ligase family protein [Candidatus Peregrinibacteria bacterium]|nr:O-antigen ligase family protein [Candidatus Peregrinibacteria bacterium]
MKPPLSQFVRKLLFISPFLFPAYFLRFQAFGIPFTATELFIYLVFGLWILSLFQDHHQVVWDKKTRWYWYAAFFILAGATLGALAAPEFISLPSGELLNAKRTTLGVWKGWVMAPILYFAVLTQVLKTEKDVEKILRYFVYSATLVCLLAYGFGLFGAGVTIDLRLRGFYESANYLALYIVPAILINIYFLLRRGAAPPSHQDYIGLSTLVVLLYSLFFTQSYAAIIGVFGALGLYAFYFFLKNPKQRKKIGLALMVLGATFVVIIATQVNTPKFRQFLDFKNRSSTTVRLEIYQTSYHLIKSHVFTGVGPGLFQANYQVNAPEVLQRAPLEWNMPHSHNIFIGFWLNAGLIGLLAFLFLIVLCHTSFAYPLIALWGILVHGLFDMPFWKNDLAMIFWLIIASVLVLQKLDVKKSRNPKSKIRKKS